MTCSNLVKYTFVSKDETSPLKNPISLVAPGFLCSLWALFLQHAGSRSRIRIELRPPAWTAVLAIGHLAPRHLFFLSLTDPSRIQAVSVTIPYFPDSISVHINSVRICPPCDRTQIRNTIVYPGLAGISIWETGVDLEQPTASRNCLE